MIKVATDLSRLEHLVYEVYMHDEMESLQGAVIPRCYEGTLQPSQRLATNEPGATVPTNQSCRVLVLLLRRWAVCCPLAKGTPIGTFARYGLLVGHR